MFHGVSHLEPSTFVYVAQFCFRLQNGGKVDLDSRNGWTQDASRPSSNLVQCSQQCVQAVTEGSEATSQPTSKQKLLAENVYEPETEVYNCTACLKVFSSKGDKFSHETQTHTGNLNSKSTVVLENSEEHYSCSLCQAFFNSKTELVEHEEKNHNLYMQVEEVGEVVEVDSCEADTQELICVQEIGQVQCRQKFIENYVDSAHCTATDLYKCKFCNKGFHTENELFMHKLGEHDFTPVGLSQVPEIGDQLELKKFSCPSRQMFNFDSKFNSLAINMGIKGTQNAFVCQKNGGEKFECPQCKVTFRLKSQLFKHEITEHDGVTNTQEKNSIPSKTMVHQIQLMKHFKCLLCEETFSSSSQLFRHEIMIHDGRQICVQDNVDINEIPCDQKMVYTVKEQVAEHDISAKTEELSELYKCPTCGHFFDAKWPLLYHECKVHNRTVNEQKNMEAKEVVESDLEEMTILKENMKRHNKRKKTDINSAETMSSGRRLKKRDSQKQFYNEVTVKVEEKAIQKTGNKTAQKRKVDVKIKNTRPEKQNEDLNQSRQMGKRGTIESNKKWSGTKTSIQKRQDMLGLDGSQKIPQKISQNKHLQVIRHLVPSGLQVQEGRGRSTKTLMSLEVGQKGNEQHRNMSAKSSSLSQQLLLSGINTQHGAQEMRTSATETNSISSSDGHNMILRSTDGVTQVLLLSCVNMQQSGQDSETNQEISKGNGEGKRLLLLLGIGGQEPKTTQHMEQQRKSKGNR